MAWTTLALRIMLSGIARVLRVVLPCALVANCYEHDQTPACTPGSRACSPGAGSATLPDAGDGGENTAGGRGSEPGGGGAGMGAISRGGGPPVGEAGDGPRDGRSGEGGAGPHGSSRVGGGAGPRASECKPHVVELSVRDTIHANGADVPSCSVGRNGELTLVYTPPELDDCRATDPARESTAGAGGADFDDPPWRGCEFAAHQDLSGFMQGLGMLDVEVCVDGAPEGEVNIWYQDANGTRLNLVLLYTWEPRNLGCRHLLFRRDDREGAADCPFRKGKDLKLCAAASAGDGGQAGQSGSGSDGGAPGDSSATYADSTLQLMAEHCDTALSPRPGTAKPVTITLVSFAYRPRACFCESNDECSGNQSCSRDAWPVLACCACSQDCPGLCTE